MAARPPVEAELGDRRRPVGQQPRLEIGIGPRPGDDGRAATFGNLLSTSPRYGVPREEARVLIEAMRARVSGRWYPVCRSAGMSEADCGYLAPAFEFDGFGTA